MKDKATPGAVVVVDSSIAGFKAVKLEGTFQLPLDDVDSLAVNFERVTPFGVDFVLLESEPDGGDAVTAIEEFDDFNDYDADGHVIGFHARSGVRVQLTPAQLDKLIAGLQLARAKAEECKLEQLEMRAAGYLVG